MNFVYWIRIEILTSFFVSFGCSVFMAMRYFFKPKLAICDDLEKHMRTPQIDTLVALMPLCHAFLNEFVPWGICTYMVTTGSRDHRTMMPSMQLPSDIYFAFCTQSVSLVTIFLFIFVSWSKGPDWWTRGAPYLYFGLLITWGIIMPTANIAYFLGQTLANN